MKRHVLLILVLGTCFILVGLVVFRNVSRTAPAVGGSNEIDSNPSSRVPQIANSFPSRAERAQMSDEVLLALLERLGHLPEDAQLGEDGREWHLAQKTSWWGSPLDPKKFWAGRVVWLDESAQLAARKYGRGYPPQPCEDSGLLRYPDDEGRNWNYSGVEGPSVNFVVSSKESGFWDKFSKTHPKPPNAIARQQQNSSESLLELRHEYEQRGNPRGRTPEELAQIEATYRRRAVELGYPQEAFEYEALFWSYVQAARQEYKELLDTGQTTNSIRLKKLFAQLAVDANYITDPLTDAQVKAANAWKISYLQRLRREKVDESYIIAYLKSWNLSPEAVFSKTNQP